MIFNALPKKIVYGVWIGCLFTANCLAQVKIVPLPQQQTHTQARIKQTQNDSPLQLPFWDDFSSARFFPDTALWVNSQNIQISGTISINPPTINVAAFDGFDANGNPYGGSGNNSGLGDQLTSKAIDLASVPDEKKSSLYFSFFWQAQGLGDKPDVEDSLRLQFKSSQGNWHTHWVMNGSNVSRTQFKHATPILIQDLDDFTEEETFFHDDFQFRFQEFGNLTFLFDNWQIDYVYLDYDRNALDTAYFDRALTAPPTSLFSSFYSIPFAHALKYGDQYVTAPQAGFYNLSSEGLQALDFSAIVLVKGPNQKIPIDTLNFETVLNPLPQAFDRRTLQANPFNSQKLMSFTDSSSIELETLFYLKSRDTVTTNRNLRLNDTVRTQHTLDNFYSYDDGTAELGAGISKRGGQLAYEYIIPEQDSLTGIDIYFPAIVSSQTASSFQLKVWSKLNNDPESLIYDETFPIQQSSRLNDLKRYLFNGYVVVKDTFYIGYEQNSDGFLAVGLDVNTNSTDKIYFNTEANGNWEVNNEVKNGSLMIRPIFDQVEVTGIEEPKPIPEISKLKVFPNPSHGTFTISKAFQNLKILNIQGQPVSFQLQNNTIDISTQPDGLYIIHFLHQGQSYTDKILLKNP